MHENQAFPLAFLDDFAVFGIQPVTIFLDSLFENRVFIVWRSTHRQFFYCPHSFAHVRSLDARVFSIARARNVESQFLLIKMIRPTLRFDVRA